MEMRKKCHGKRKKKIEVRALVFALSIESRRVWACITPRMFSNNKLRARASRVSANITFQKSGHYVIDV